MNLPERVDSPKAARSAPAGRLRRLCAKELKETLRDRRTILTLLIMPLLMYPTLGIIFKKFLLTNMESSRVLSGIVGVDNEPVAGLLQKFFDQADEVLAEQRESIQESASGVTVGGEKFLPKSPDDIQSLGDSTVNFVAVDDLRAAVANGTIDVGVQVVSTPPSDGPRSVRFRLLHQAGSNMSRRTLEYVTRRLHAFNEGYATERLRQLGDPGVLPTEVVYERIESGRTVISSLATLVPVILVLMTVTGAVYPAIDLTAGERERGTLETLIAAPVPRIQLLLAKYSAVVTVALLTATANVISMTLTLYASGLGATIFGPHALTPGVIVAVFGLMGLFAAFFSALLLSITSFARTFKEAQAYLVPLILCSLAPSLMCLTPGIRLSGLLAICPLVNIVLLARDVLQGSVDYTLAIVTIASTAIYAAGAIGLAAKIFGSDTIVYGSHATWADLFHRPDEPTETATLSGACLFLALLFPMYVLMVDFLALWQPDSVLVRLVMSAFVTAFLFGLMPWLFVKYGRIKTVSAFELRPARWLSFAGAVVLGLSIWPLLHQLVVLTRMVGLFSVSEEQFQAVELLLTECRALPPAILLLTMAVVPAVFEELFFRGYLFSALRSSLSPAKTILCSAVLFGAFHVLAKSMLATERFLPTTTMGLVLGWVCWRSGSIFPGMLLHACHNGLLLLIFYYRDEIADLGWGMKEESNLPIQWILLSLAGSLLGASLVFAGRRRKTLLRSE